MQSFENRMLQLKTKPKNRISENSVQPQGDEGKSLKAFPTAWITAPSQLNPDRDKIFHFSTTTSDHQFGVHLDSASRFAFGAPINQVVHPMPGSHALSQLTPDRDKIFEFSGATNFQGSSGTTTSAATGFKFGATANLHPPPASSTAPYSSEAAYQAYVKRVLDVTPIQGFLKRTPMKSRSTKLTDDAAYQQYLKRALGSSSHQDLIKHSIPSGWKKAAGTLSDDLVAENCTSLDNHIVPVHTSAPAHVSQHIPEISPYITAAWGHLPNWAELRESFVAEAASAAQFGYPWDETAHFKRLTSLWEHQRLLAVEKLKPLLVWSAQLMDIGDHERTYCRQRHISQQALQQTWSSPTKEELIEMILRSLQIRGVEPIGFSQQYATQLDVPSKVLYVQGSWLSSFVFKVTSSRFELKEDFSSLDIRICPGSLVERVRTSMLPLTFQPFHIGSSQGLEDHLLAALRDIAADPCQCSRGWLGHFSLAQMVLLEKIFKPYGQVPWDDLIDPLWTDLLSHVDEAWLALDSGFMRPDEERLPLACLPGATDSSPPPDCVEAASCGLELPPAPLSPSPASASIPSSKAMRAGGDGTHELSPALKLRLQCSLSYRRRHPSSCIRTLSIPARVLSSRTVTVPFTHIAHFMRRSVYYPLAVCVAPLVASLHSCVVCACYTTSMSPPPPLDASAWVEIPLALVGDIVAY